MSITRIGGTASGPRYAVLQDQKASTTVGQTTVVNSWNKMDLNTKVSDPQNIVNLANNQFTLGPGRYVVRWQATHRGTGDAFKSRLYNASDAVLMAYGINNIGSTMNLSHGTFEFAIGQAKTFQIDVYPVVAGVAGYETSIAAVPEIYTTVEVDKLG